MEEVQQDYLFEKGPTPDERWKIFGVDSYTDYLRRLNGAIYLKDEVNGEVRSAFRVVQRILELSYYEYELLDVACMKSLFALEMALKIRFEEVKPSPNIKTPNNFQAYLKWFMRNGYFEVDDEFGLEQLRWIRNHFAHPVSHSFGGPMTSWQVSAASDLINDMHEDVILRKERKFEAKNIKELIANNFPNGGILEDENGENKFVYHFVIGYINNKQMAKRYYFFSKTIFEIPKQYSAKDSMNIYPFSEHCCNVISFVGDSMFGLDELGNVVFKLYNPVTPEDIQLFNEWIEEFQRYSETMVVFSHGDSRSIRDRIGMLRSEFHKD